MIASFQVFKGVRVHGISCLPLTDTVTDTSLTFRVAVFGERRLKLCLFNIQLPHHNKQTIVHLLSFQSLPNLGHWVLDVCFIQVVKESLLISIAIYGFLQCSLLCSLRSCSVVGICNSSRESVSCHWMHRQHSVFLGHLDIYNQLSGELSRYVCFFTYLHLQHYVMLHTYFQDIVCCFSFSHFPPSFIHRQMSSVYDAHLGSQN